MSPRTTGRRRMFGRARKTVKIEGQKFPVVYSMSKVLVHEPPPPRKLDREGGVHPASQPIGLNPLARVHGPFQTEFDYTPFMPKRRNGRWVPGKWLPVIPKDELAMCRYGYHACTMDRVERWVSYHQGGGERVWLVEGVGPLEQSPQSQQPQTTQIVYHMSKPRGKWVDGRWKVPEPRRVRDRKAERVRNAKVVRAKENGGFVYDMSAEKYNFQSIRIIRPITDAPKREKKRPKRAPTTWRMMRIYKGRPSVRVQVYASSGRIVPGQGVRAPRKRR